MAKDGDGMEGVSIDIVRVELGGGFVEYGEKPTRQKPAHAQHRRTIHIQIHVKRTESLRQTHATTGV